VRSVSQARIFLQRHGASQEESLRLLAALQAQGGLDDRACARLWADHWARAGWASEAIHGKLLQKGLSVSTVVSAIAAMGLDVEDEARARQLIRQRGKRKSSRLSLSRLLAARGFDAGLIARVLGASEEVIPSE